MIFETECCSTKKLPMKNRLYILLALFFCTGTAVRTPHGSGRAAASADAMRPAADSVAAAPAANTRPFLRNDTLFYCDRRETVDGYTLTFKVFVDSDLRSPNRLRLHDIASLRSPKAREELADDLRNLRRKHPGAFARRDLRQFSATWLPLRSVGGKLYIDELNFCPLRLTDTLCIEQGQDGPRASVYTHVGQPAATHLQFRTNSAYPPEGDRSFDLYLIDTLRGIAVLAEQSEHAETHYRLLVAEREAARFDLLVWECSEIPDGSEAPGDAFDYPKIIETGLLPTKP